MVGTRMGAEHEDRLITEDLRTCFGRRSPRPKDTGGFNEPNKTVNKFYLHGTNSVPEGLRHC